MKILTIADKKEEKFLRTKTAEFNFDKYSKKDIADLIKKMREIMVKANGIGLSANQLGLDLRLFVAKIPQTQINTDRNKDRHGYNISINPRYRPHKSASYKFYSIFNPTIVKSSKKTTTLEEGCLSVPGVYGLVERPEKITLTGFDKNGRGIKIKANGLLARVFQHETDHLNGILFTDKCKEIYKISDS